ncbi:urease accessory protein UreE [Oceanibacterium hippocampi]|uniref:Urease accessory protein UreE n=1 Tax=Oceanibacterium hippocampi TaxID=745714 RepID=A0A1Y5TEK3_9PROT|nr:urease accessory protein UreE [Oceanibacterium hippocampi]SLN62122.1 Urease accessory protein UreE 1 [Oceanibacterium hippocampi]
MERAIEHRPRGNWPADAAGDSVTLDFHDRHRRRIRLATDGGNAVLLDLPKAIAMADGDGLKTEAGAWIAVRAAPEALLDITADDSHHLIRLAWHLGNRHIPAEIDAARIRIRPDHVIAEMLRGLGGRVVEVTAPFQPESGAYAGTGAGDVHDHGHGHEHHHGDGHDHGHGH